MCTTGKDGDLQQWTVRYGTSGLTGSNIHRTQVWSCAPGGAGHKDRPTVSCDVTAVLTFVFLQG